jgi:hypothetical protein
MLHSLECRQIQRIGAAPLHPLIGNLFRVRLVQSLDPFAGILQSRDTRCRRF